MKQRALMAAVAACLALAAQPASAAGAEKAAAQRGAERAKTESVTGWPLIASALGTASDAPTVERWKAQPARTAAAEMIGFAASPARAWPGRIGSPSRVDYMRAAIAATTAANAIAERVAQGVTVGALRSVETARSRARELFGKLKDAELAEVVASAIKKAEATEPADVLQSAEVIFGARLDGEAFDFEHGREGLTVARAGRLWFGQDTISGRKVEFRIARNAGEKNERTADVLFSEKVKK